MFKLSLVEIRCMENFVDFKKKKPFYNSDNPAVMSKYAEGV